MGKETKKRVLELKLVSFARWIYTGSVYGTVDNYVHHKHWADVHNRASRPKMVVSSARTFISVLRQGAVQCSMTRP